MTDQPVKVWTAETILQTLNEHRQQLYDLGVRKIGLFGSHVRGEQTPDSDMDFLVQLADQKFRTYTNILDYLETIFGGEIDLVMEDAVKPRIKPYIMQEVTYVERLQSIP